MWTTDKGIKRKITKEKEKAWQLRSYFKNTIKENASQYSLSATALLTF